MPTIITAGPEHHLQLVDVWESAVRATHTFLTETDISMLRTSILKDYLHVVTLRAWVDAQGAIGGFIGVDGSRIEMLFVDAALRGQGIGAALLRHGVDTLRATEVDVNEQNPQAVGFYERMGFAVFARSPLDGMGNPFPLLHMRVRTQD